MLLLIERVGNLFISWQQLFLFRPLKKDLALNQVFEHRQAGLRESMAGKLRLLALRLLLDQPFDFGNHYLLAIDSRGHSIGRAGVASRATGRKKDGANQGHQREKVFCLHVNSYSLSLR